MVDGEFLLDLLENLFKIGYFYVDVDVIIGVIFNEGVLFVMIMFCN